MTRKSEERSPRKGRKAEAAALVPGRAPAKKPVGRKPAKKPARRPRRKPVADIQVAAPAPPEPPRVPPEQVLEAFNRAYYDAFQSLDLEQIDRIWWHDEHTVCIHPGWDARHGWAETRKTFEDIFANTKSIRFALGDVRVRVVGDIGWVTCVENLVSEESDSGDYLGAVLATNVYERRHGEWRMILHHTSAFASDEADLPEGPLH